MNVTQPPTDPTVRLQVRVELGREAVRVQPIGELDLATIPDLAERVSDLLATGFERLIIDLRGLSFLDASGLQLVLNLVGQARTEGWRLSFFPGGEQVRRIFELTGTLSLLALDSPPSPTV